LILVNFRSEFFAVEVKGCACILSRIQTLHKSFELLF